MEGSSICVLGGGELQTELVKAPGAGRTLWFAEILGGSLAQFGALPVPAVTLGWGAGEHKALVLSEPQRSCREQSPSLGRGEGQGLPWAASPGGATPEIPLQWGMHSSAFPGVPQHLHLWH